MGDSLPWLNQLALLELLEHGVATRVALGAPDFSQLLGRLVLRRIDLAWNASARLRGMKRLEVESPNLDSRSTHWRAKCLPMVRTPTHRSNKARSFL